MTGVAMWFTSIQVSPRTIGDAGRRIPLALGHRMDVFLRSSGLGLRVSEIQGSAERPRPDALAGAFTRWPPGSACSGSTGSCRSREPGLAGPVTHNVWTGFFNASFWPSLLYRTVAAMAIAALAACVVINVASSLEQQARHELIGHATRFLVPLVVMPLVGVWFLTSMLPTIVRGCWGQT